MAREAGYANTYTFDSLEDWDRNLDTLLKEDGPIMVDLKVEPGEDYPENFSACTAPSTGTVSARRWRSRKSHSG